MRRTILSLVALAFGGSAPAAESPPAASTIPDLLAPARQRLADAGDAKALATATAGLAGMIEAAGLDEAGRDAARREARAAVLAARDRLVARIRGAVEADLRGRLPTVRAELAKRREAAVGHIEDDAAYPEGEKGKEAQARVDAKVAAVRELWESPLLAHGRMTPAVPADLDALSAAVAAALEAAGLERLAKDAVRLEEALADPGGALARLLRDTPGSPFEQRLLDQNRKVSAFNAAVAGLPAEAAAQIAITNAYREMLGRSVLQIDPALTAAAQGHSEAMAKAKRLFHRDGGDGTPESRIRKAGYEPLAIGENICGVAASAQAAHVLWAGSAGHHRSLVSALFNQIGVGHAEGYWTQCFGRGPGWKLGG